MLNKGQDAVVKFLRDLMLRIAKLLPRWGRAGDEAAKAIPAFTLESKQTLDAVERLADGVKFDIHGIAEEVCDLIKTGGVKITIDTPVVIHIIREKGGEKT